MGIHLTIQCYYLMFVIKKCYKIKDYLVIQNTNKRRFSCKDVSVTLAECYHLKYLLDVMFVCVMLKL
jgi:hypothetical protein